jgi:hypothetical protein
MFHLTWYVLIGLISEVIRGRAMNAEKSKKNDYRLSATAVRPLSMSPA